MWPKVLIQKKLSVSLEMFQIIPQDGIIFKDIAPLLLSPIALQSVYEQLAASNHNATLVAGIEARGFIFGPLVANIFVGVGFVPLKKTGQAS